MCCNITDCDFLAESPCKNIVLLALSGSRGYGTDIEGSDIDIRGVALNSPENILLMNDFGSYHSSTSDTTIYSLEKFFKLASNCNPAAIELLGFDKNKYIYLNEFGIAIIDNKDVFLSKLCIKPFEGYANQTLKNIEKIKQSTRDECKINKNILHYIRLKTMLIEILEKGEINTYRKDRKFLLQVRNGLFFNNGEFNSDYKCFVNSLNNRLEYAKRNTCLPDLPNYKSINEIHKSINYNLIYQNKE